MSLSNLIVTKELQKSYIVGDNAIYALKKCNIAIGKGEQIAIMGPSGSGKSTLLSLLGGIMKPSDGEIVIDGTNITELGENDLSEFRRKNIGFVFQNFNLIPEMTAKQNILLPLKLGGTKKFDNDYIKSVCDTLGISSRLSHLPSQLSGGQQQRIAIARAIVTKPSLILCDEPTGNLDSASGEEVMKLLLDVCNTSGSTLIVVTHDSKVASRLQRTIEIYDGEVK